MRLTDRDIGVVGSVNENRILRNGQAQRLLIPNKNTADETLERLYESGILQPHWLTAE